MTVPGLMVWREMQTVQVMVLLLFASNAIVYAIFQYLVWRTAEEKEIVPAGAEEEGVELLGRAGPTDKSVIAGKEGEKSVATSGGAVVKAPPKELTKPFTGSFECCITLTRELFKTSALMAFTYICERHWYLEHSGKEYSRDHFLFILFIFFLYAFYTIKPIKDTSLLGREQTEEWKGWMQFIFLLYHYFHAEEVYNSVRVMITCYVWMTGFGNFSFFYIKQDFGWLRVAQMMWRLNFSVLLLMWTHGNTWILYYICPMHTFYFLMVYATMCVYHGVNHTKWGIRYKLMAVGVIIYIIWDVNGGIFDVLFAWLGTDKVIGANNGSVWEYYFRTSLDHWSSYLGMIFALNYPLIEQYYKLAVGGPLYVAAVIMFILTFWWFWSIYTKPKLQYNLLHSYFAIIPLTSYIFFRNISTAVRSGISMSLHDLGKTTLETYLLQHHIWLTSNAKTLLTWVPNHPYINFAFATMVFFVVSKELYRLTMSLRGLIIPDDAALAKTNLLGMFVLLAVLYALAFLLQTNDASVAQMLMASSMLAAVIVQLLARYNAKLIAHTVYQSHTVKASLFCAALLAVAFVVHVATQASPINSADMTVPAVTGSGPGGLHALPVTLLPECGNALSQGKWLENDCSHQKRRRQLQLQGGRGRGTALPQQGHSSPSTLENAIEKEKYSPSMPARQLAIEALCEQLKWTWNQPAANSVCPAPRKISTLQAQGLFSGRVITFLGDSVVRQSYHQFAALLDASYDPVSPISFDTKHSDLSHNIPSVNAKVHFQWAPYASNVTIIMSSGAGPAPASDYVIAGGGLWDALHARSVSSYENEIKNLAAAFRTLHAKHAASIKKTEVAGALGHSTGSVAVTTRPFPVYVWLQPTTIFDARLSPEKKQHMSEDTIRTYRHVAVTGLTGAVDLVLDATTASSVRSDGSMDGIHFVDSVYQVIAQMIANAYGLRYPKRLTTGPSPPVSKPYKPKETGSMSSPWYGLLVLGISCIMLWGMDSLLGIGNLSLSLFGRKADWDQAYGPMHKKLGISAAGVSTGGEPAGASGADVSETPEKKGSVPV